MGHQDRLQYPVQLLIIFLSLLISYRQKSLCLFSFPINQTDLAVFLNILGPNDLLYYTYLYVSLFPHISIALFPTSFAFCCQLFCTACDTNGTIHIAVNWLNLEPCTALPPSPTSSSLHSQHKCVSNKLLLLLFCFSAKRRYKPASVLTLPAGLGAAVLHLPQANASLPCPHDIECRLAAYPSYPNCCIVCQIGSSLHSN